MSEQENTVNENDHSHDKPSYDDVNTPVVIMIGFVSVVLTALTIALVQGIYNHWRSVVVDEVRGQQTADRRQAIVNGQLDQLKANDKGRISIEDAIQETLKQYSGDQ